jgi:hypothetical protein
MQAESSVDPQTLAPSTAPSPLLLSALSPVRLLLQSFLTESEAARLTAVSRCFSRAVLAGFVFHERAFVIRGWQELLQLRAVYEPCGMRITRLDIVRSFVSRYMKEGARRRCYVPPSVLKASVYYPWGHCTGTYRNLPTSLPMPSGAPRWRPWKSVGCW